MIAVDKLYQAVKSQSNSDITGWIDDNDFNSFLRNSELELIEFLTGKVDQPPVPFVSKNVDWLQPFIKTKTGNFKNSVAPLPDDYFHFNRFSILTESKAWKKVEVMTPPQAQERIESHIEEVKAKYAASIVDGTVSIIQPGVQSEYKFIYYRYPVFGVYGSSEDIYKDLVYDAAKSKNLEWPQITEPYFVFKINEFINKRNREIVAAQMNAKP